MESTLLEAIVQAGAVGLAIFAMFIVWKLSSNHIRHNSEILQELKDAIRELTEFLKK